MPRQKAVAVKPKYTDKEKTALELKMSLERIEEARNKAIENHRIKVNFKKIMYGGTL